MDTLKDTWGPDAVRSLRARLALSQSEFAEIVGVNRAATISDWEYGRRNPAGSARVLLSLIDRFDGLPLDTETA